MSERGIIFSGPMVRALLEGRKSVTRRIIKPQPVDRDRIIAANGGFLCGRLRDSENAWREIRCPYKPGDRLYVRELGWQPKEPSIRELRDGADTWPKYVYDADGISENDSDDYKRWGWKRRPSIHMPKWAARIWLEVVSVRPERANAMSEDDAREEGCDSLDEFIAYWDMLYKRNEWGKGPWVWVLKFRRV